ncbi:class I SAM-dependent methyltransferase [Alkalinema sp. FACHB-956]|uniref:class I SAM-dependent methyltransferase n=1 Tax=Alkalinema sp. FACHB-956 TaxID=2692768 RepID=UPI0016829911|nr:class I SAM-dependent methyltransferase [Alkalinema sp. FACHB-956]MBD2326994.1 class I SAM-dependent methyltransferase [Alkalinema sp. FACHB-956]
MALDVSLSNPPISDPGNPELIRLIVDQIQQRSRLTFAEFMELALYQPDQGYYVRRASKIGATGDFFTSPHLGADFGEMLAEQFVQMWEILGQPQPFTLVEMGAGQGLLASDVLRYLTQHYPDCARSLQYCLVEKVATLIAAQKRQLMPWIDQGLAIRWTNLEALAEAPIVGCFFSNELIDAFPVHQIQIQAGQLQEIYVGWNGTQFIEIVDRPSIPALVNYFDRLGINLTAPDYADGYRSEVNLLALDWMQAVAAGLQRGYVLTIDYGYPASRYYSRVRSQGTLQCYYQHSHHNDPYQHVGMQDITAHVNFTALELQGQQSGLQTVGVTQQAMFLMALGLGDRIASLSHSTAEAPPEINALLQRRDALHSLINPMGLGNFGVLVQSKGLAEAEKQQALTGFTIPDRMF